jgi:hypothetical protein
MKKNAWYIEEVMTKEVIHSFPVKTMLYANDSTNDVDIREITCGKEIHKITLKLFKFIEHEKRHSPGKFEYRFNRKNGRGIFQLFRILNNPSTEARTLANIISREIVFSEDNVTTNKEVREHALKHPNANKKIVACCFQYLLPDSLRYGTSCNGWLEPWEIFKKVYNIKLLNH